MTTVRALLSFMQGTEAYRRRATASLYGSPFTLRLHYVNGHPAIPESQSVWVGRVADHLRLVGERGERVYDIPVTRVKGIAYDPQGLVRLRFEPTAGLVSTAVFRLEGDAGAAYQKLLHMLLVTA